MHISIHGCSLGFWRAPASTSPKATGPQAHYGALQGTCCPSTLAIRYLERSPRYPIPLDILISHYKSGIQYLCSSHQLAGCPLPDLHVIEIDQGCLTWPTRTHPFASRSLPSALANRDEDDCGLLTFSLLFSVVCEFLPSLLYFQYFSYCLRPFYSIALLYVKILSTSKPPSACSLTRLRDQ